jgi:phage-related protein
MILIGDEKGNTTEVDFYVDEDNILQPLGILVTKDSRYELLPATRDNTEEIPGMHGEYDFGTEFKVRSLELDVASLENEIFSKKELQFLYAKYLDPTKGVKTLVFADDIQKLYKVKYSGKIDLTQYANWFKFTIPFKMSNPLIFGTFEKVLAGSGTLINGGTFETGLIIEIAGPATNPSITIEPIF